MTTPSTAVSNAARRNVKTEGARFTRALAGATTFGDVGGQSGQREAKDSQERGEQPVELPQQHHWVRDDAPEDHCGCGGHCSPTAERCHEAREADDLPCQLGFLGLRVPREICNESWKGVTSDCFDERCLFQRLSCRSVALVAAALGACNFPGMSYCSPGMLRAEGSPTRSQCLAVRAGKKTLQKAPAFAPPGPNCEGALSMGPKPPAATYAQTRSATHNLQDADEVSPCLFCFIWQQDKIHQDKQNCQLACAEEHWRVRDESWVKERHSGVPDQDGCTEGLQSLVLRISIPQDGHLQTPEGREPNQVQPRDAQRGQDLSAPSQQHAQARAGATKQCVQQLCDGLPANPRLDTKPAAGHKAPQKAGHVSTVHAKGRTREHREMGRHTSSQGGRSGSWVGRNQKVSEKHSGNALAPAHA